MNYPSSNINYPPNGNNPAPSGNPSIAKPPKRTPIACVKCRDRKIKCIPGPSPSYPCSRCREQNQECVYLSVAEHTQQRSQASPEPTDVYPPYEQAPMSHPPPPPPAVPMHYSQSPPSMVPMYSHPHHSPPNQSYQQSGYQNTVHQNAPLSGPSPPSNLSPVSQYPPSPDQNRSYFAGPSPSSNVPPASQAFSYSPPSSIQSTSPNYIANPYFDSAYQGQPTQGQPIRVPPARGQPTRGPPIQGLPMGSQQNNGSFQPPYY